jgi:hypothetical protein
MRNPVRTGGRTIKLNSPDGWVSASDPFDWTISTHPGMWIGESLEDGCSPIGPNGPWTRHRQHMPTAIERATGLIVGPLAAVWPWRVYRGSWMASDAEQLPTPTWLRDPTLINRTPGVAPEVQWELPAPMKRTGPRFWGEVIRHALWFGRGWYAHRVTELGAPIAGTFVNIAPNLVDDREDGLGWVVGHGDLVLETNRAGVWEEPGGVWQLRCLEEPLGDGRGVIGRHAHTMHMAVQVARYTSDTFRAGIPAGYLKVTQPGLDRQTADALKSSWLRSHEGRRSIAVLNATTDFNALSITPIDAELAKVDHQIRAHIAHAFNLSAWALDAGTTGNDYANITDRRQDKVDDTLMPWKRAIEETFAAQLLPFGTWLELETRGYLQTDPERRMAYFGAGMKEGLFTAEYAQDLERIPMRFRPDTTPQETTPQEAVS